MDEIIKRLEMLYRDISSCVSFLEMIQATGDTALDLNSVLESYRILGRNATGLWVLAVAEQQEPGIISRMLKEREANPPSPVDLDLEAQFKKIVDNFNLGE